MLDTPVAALEAAIQHSLDWFLYDNACFLAERLYYEAATDKATLLLGKCYFLSGQVRRAYQVLKKCPLPAARYLFARCCLDMRRAHLFTAAVLPSFQEGDLALIGLDMATEPQNLSRFTGHNGAAEWLHGSLLLQANRKREATRLLRKSWEQNGYLFTSFDAICQLDDKPVDVQQGFQDQTLATRLALANGQPHMRPMTSSTAVPSVTPRHNTATLPVATAVTSGTPKMLDESAASPPLQELDLSGMQSLPQTANATPASRRGRTRTAHVRQTLSFDSPAESQPSTLASAAKAKPEPSRLRASSASTAAASPLVSSIPPGPNFETPPAALSNEQQTPGVISTQFSLRPVACEKACPFRSLTPESYAVEAQPPRRSQRIARKEAGAKRSHNVAHGEVGHLLTAPDSPVEEGGVEQTPDVQPAHPARPAFPEKQGVARRKFKPRASKLSFQTPQADAKTPDDLDTSDGLAQADFTTPESADPNERWTAPGSHASTPTAVHPITRQAREEGSSDPGTPDPEPEHASEKQQAQDHQPRPVDLTSSHALAVQILLPVYRAVAAMGHYNCHSAIDAIETLPVKHQNSGFVQVLLGRAYMELADYDAAEQAFRSARRFEKHRLSGLEYYSTVLWHMAKITDLAYLANEVMTIDPKHAVSCLQKEADRACQYFQRAVQLDPTFAYAYTLLGHEFSANNDHERAQACFRQALAQNRRLYNAWFGLGMLAARQERLVEAEKQLILATRINPSSPILRCHLGKVLGMRGRFVLALRVLDKAYEMAPENPLVRYTRASMLISLNRYPEALTELEKLLVDAPKESVVYFMLGKVHERVRS
ncbi:uncharacterized protein MONBRDRAFT_26880 [Monosiga brevicollis MX1]|uniref:Uncharacterized protein n=1 Tax=Monosiga brevicollis TaxID=81824 RepID=A9V3T3_MONBE|nr:uncharacterized protein MONBRDRAFT_26880 [Monosiga brevicollis MX1]EDQ87762.1 predicted protein [Monosiga brevicollis MX1]|eukprot:XP_001747295.1 hypothetical protein [Monosiga brevicollis MX1]